MDFNSSPQGSIRLFEFRGIRVFLHWSWFFAALYFISTGSRLYPSGGWPLLECLALFGIVLLHEFGHSLATRQTGGHADTILLWPLGGLAFVQPPDRPSAHLWSIAAGPLVNLVLWPVFYLLKWWAAGHVTDLGLLIFIHRLFWINQSLLLFNLLPLYPMDGGQMLRALLWYRQGAIRSLQHASIVGFVGSVIVGVGALILYGTLWIPFIMVNNMLVSWRAFHDASGVIPFGWSVPRLRMPDWKRLLSRKSKSRTPAEIYKPKIKPRQDLYPEKKAVVEVDTVLDKIHREGMQSLTPAEREALQRASAKLKEE